MGTIPDVPTRQGAFANAVHGDFLACPIPDLLARVLPHCPADWIDDDARTRLRALSAAYPTIGSLAAFEVPLERGAPARLDFGICMRAANGEGARFAAATPENEGEDDRARDGWRSPHDFLRTWSQPGSGLATAFPVVWLAFGLEPAASAPPAPFVHATLAATGAARSPSPSLEQALALLSGGQGPPPAVRRALERCLRELPAQGALLHVASRPGGPVEPLRAVFGVPLADVPEYLDRVGWPGSRGDLVAYLGATCRATPRPALHLDLGPQLGPRIGIEHYFPGPPADDLRWHTLLDTLVDWGACTRERRAQLVAWPSHDDPACAPHERVDRDLVLRVVYETGGPLRALASLPFGVLATPRRIAEPRRTRRGWHWESG